VEPTIRNDPRRDELQGETPKMQTNRRAGMAAAVALGVAAALWLGNPAGVRARADDAKTQEVDAGGLTFQAPADWKSTPPQSQMRRAQLKVPAAEGEASADLIVFAFPGGAGSVEANIERWERTFKDKNGDTPKADVKTVKGKNCEVTRVELAGSYTPTTFPGQAQQPNIEKARLLGAIVLTDRTGYFLRLVGPEKTVSAAKTAFDKMLGTMKVEEK